MTTPDRPRRGRPGYDAEKLLAAAVKVFTERGYDGTTMDDLARALRLSKSSIYHHVTGKQALLMQALDRALVGLESSLDGADALEGTATERLEATVRSSVAVLIDDLPFVTLLLRVRGNTDVERAALTRRRRIDSRFADMVAAAQDGGGLRADLEPQLVARLVFGTVNSLIEWYRPGRGSRPDDVADAVCGLVFDGLHPR